MSRYKVEVDLLLCQGQGVCIEEGPKVFEVINMESGYPKVRVQVEYPDESLRSRVQDAVRFCPKQTIQLLEIS